MRETKYNTNLCKVGFLIEDTTLLITQWNPGMTKDSFISLNTLGKSSDMRIKDCINRVFWPFYMSKPSVVCWLKTIKEKGITMSVFKQLLMLYFMRGNAIVYDYICQRLNKHKLENNVLAKTDTQHYLQSLTDEGKIPQWKESTFRRVSSGISKTLSEFDFISKSGKDNFNILPIIPSAFTILYLMHELHFEGLSDVAIWNHEDWQLFGLDKQQVLEVILENSLNGGYIAQATGDLLTISWSYNSMEDFINGTL